jgi:hypothetical protein
MHIDHDPILQSKIVTIIGEQLKLIIPDLATQSRCRGGISAKARAPIPLLLCPHGGGYQVFETGLGRGITEHGDDNTLQTSRDGPCLPAELIPAAGYAEHQYH